MGDLKNKKIAVVLGGLSKERAVSLKTGEAIFKSLKGSGYNVIKFDPKLDGIQKLIDEAVQIAFIALHGSLGEDGCIQGVLETLKIPYTGSGVLSSALCYDKVKTKQFLEKHHILTPQFWVYNNQNIDDFLSCHQIKVPVIAKPNKEGSSFGAVIIKDNKDLKTGILKAKDYGPEVLIEEFITGKEITVGLVNGRALPSIEIAPMSGFYDYEAKYTPGKTEYFVPARIPESLEDEIKKKSEIIVSLLSCKGSPRVDYMLDDNNKFYFLEVNTIPGMTETSLLPKAVKGIGKNFNWLCEQILKTADLENSNLI